MIVQPKNNLNGSTVIKNPTIRNYGTTTQDNMASMSALQQPSNDKNQATTKWIITDIPYSYGSKVVLLNSVC